MIEGSDWEPLLAHSQVDYIESEKMSEAELAGLCAGYDYLMLNYDLVHNLSPDFYRRPEVSELKGISCDLTGMDWCSPQAAKAAGVQLFFVPYYSTRSVAESMLAEILLHSRQRHLAYLDQINGLEPQARQGINLYGRVAGVVGMGNIGSHIASLLRNLGMHVMEWHYRRPDLSSSLVEIFSRSDVICVCSATVREGADRNVGMINKNLLNLSNQAIVVNLANSLLVDDQAMAWAIGEGKVAAYSVDRWPEMHSSPLMGLPQVHMSPANAWSSPESLAELRRVWVDNTLQAILGKPQNIHPV